jgi:hypothetical protein
VSLVSLRAKALTLRKPETDNARTTRHEIVWLLLMMRMLVLHHIPITYVSFSLINSASTSLEICHIVECQLRPIRVARVYADKFEFFEDNKFFHVERWIKTA